MTVFAKLIAAIVFAVASMVAISPLAATFSSEDGVGPGQIVLLLAAGLVALAAILAPTARRAFGRGFVLSGVLFLSAPLTGLLLSGRAASEVISDAQAAGGSELDIAATAAGATIGAGLMTGLFSLVGLVIGGIFVILGLVLVLGGRREVIVVERRES